MAHKQRNYAPEYKVLLLGGTGLVGRAIYQTLKDNAQILLTAEHHELPGRQLSASRRLIMASISGTAKQCCKENYESSGLFFVWQRSGLRHAQDWTS